MNHDGQTAIPWCIEHDAALTGPGAGDLDPSLCPMGDPKWSDWGWSNCVHEDVPKHWVDTDD